MKKSRITAAVCAALMLTAAFSPCVYAADVSAEAAILTEAGSGTVIYEKNADARLPMASTTKIMTAVVALENRSPEKEVTIPADACGVEGSSIYLTAGEVLTMSDLLYALLLDSANDAAAAIAIEVAGSVDAFADMMNEKAALLGLTNTHFTNPHGLHDDDHYTSARDLAALTAYALKNDAFREIVSTYKHKIPLHGDEGVRVLINHNKLLKSSHGFIGVKTGFTKKSGRCLVSAAERDGVCLISVTLNAPDDWNDHIRLAEEGFAAFRSFTLADEGEYSVSIPSVYAQSESGKVCASNKERVTLTLPANSRITSVTEAPHILLTGVDAGDTVGRVVFYADGEEIASVDLIADESAPVPEKSGFFDKIKKIFG